MQYIRTAILTISAILWAGCGAPHRSTLRIGITESAGATILYLAEETNLYTGHDVAVRTVELADFDALERAFDDREIDAMVLPHDRCVKQIRERRADAGVLLVLAVPRAFDDSAHWQSKEEELLLVRRAEVMHRRSDWAGVISAYEEVLQEHLNDPNATSEFIASREHRATEDVEREICIWQFLGISDQDSILDFRAGLKDLEARWQGNLGFAANADGSRRGRDGLSAQTELRSR